MICAEPETEFVEADCWLAAENFMVGATALGLGTCCIGLSLPVLNSPEGKAWLGIPAGVRAYAPMIVGFPHGAPAPAPRKAPVILNWIR